jgi:hypothetical protein
VGADPADASPLTFTRTAREAWRFYRLRFVQTIVLFAAIYLLSIALGATLSTMGRGEVGQAIAGIVVTITLPIFGTVGTAVACILMYDASTGRNTSVGGAFRSIRGSWKEVISAALLTSIVVILGSTFLSLLVRTPLVLLIAFLIPALPIVMFGPPILIHGIILERLLLVHAWARTRALMAGNWGRMLAYWGLLALATGLVIVLANTIPPALGAPGLVLALLTVLLYGLVIPYVIAFILVGFLDLRAQHDRPAATQAPA